MATTYSRDSGATVVPAPEIPGAKAVFVEVDGFADSVASGSQTALWWPDLEDAGSGFETAPILNGVFDAGDPAANSLITATLPGPGIYLHSMSVWWHSVDEGSGAGLGNTRQISSSLIPGWAHMVRASKTDYDNFTYTFSWVHGDSGAPQIAPLAYQDSGVALQCQIKWSCYKLGSAA
jgi:hypothetical protein